MLGRLPRLHRWVLIVLSALTGSGLGAWVSHWTVRTSEFGCGDVLLGVCLMPDVNLLPVLVGTGLGLMGAIWLVYEPDQPRRLPLDKD
ncbi:MAG TPA: OapA N-terminal domain-containing protein [Nocardioidaceae bacterium]|nr:OapA N-terminal domain-containing protein [Nocardioidaceae bacterium]